MINSVEDVLGADPSILSGKISGASLKTNWLSEMRSIMTNEIPKVIIGNKAELIPEIGQIIDRSAVEKYAESEGCFYIETSAKTGENVEKAFLELIQRMVKKVG